MARQRLVILCGLPRSGKTTIASHLAKEMDSMIVAPDVLRTMFKNRYTFKMLIEKHIFNASDVLMEYLLRQRLNVVYDEINLMVVRRAEIMAKARQINPLIAIIGCCVMTPVDECIRRAQLQDRGLGLPYWTECITELNDMFEPISIVEDFTMIMRSDELLGSDDTSLPGMHRVRLVSENY